MTQQDQISVLLLEDDDADAYLTKKELSAISRVGKVVRARNGHEAIGILQSGRFSPDMAFVDLQMPTLDGFDFMSECLSKGLANVPMVVLTSSSARNDAVRSRVRGALEVITKPESPEDLRRALRDAIERLLPSDESAAIYGGKVWDLAPLASVSAAVDNPRGAAAPASFGRRASRT